MPKGRTRVKCGGTVFTFANNIALFGDKNKLVIGVPKTALIRQIEKCFEANDGVEFAVLLPLCIFRRSRLLAIVDTI